VAFSDRIRAFIIAHKMATFLSNTFPSSQMNAQEEDAKSPPSRGGPEKEDKANTNNHYETLLVSTFASDEEIRRAYLKLALRCHPDKFGRRRRQQQEEDEEEEDANKERFQQISEAYGVLSNPELRRRYDDEGHAGFFSTASADSSSEKEYEHYLRRFRELVVLTPQGLDLEF
jgi:DnaJ-domain-containing protein 1